MHARVSIGKSAGRGTWGGVDEQYPAKFGHVCLSVAVMMNRQEGQQGGMAGLASCSCV
jgi:hypothetical protein